MRCNLGSLCLALTLALLVVAGAMGLEEAGQEPSRPRPQAGPSDETLRAGELLFRIYCRNCHGSGARGDGEMASVLRVRPADLTILKTRNKGVFPAEEAAAAIDGRTDIGPHGSRSMPVWGLSFRDPGKVGDQESEVAYRIEALVRYLESIQR